MAAHHPPLPSVQSVRRRPLPAEGGGTITGFLPDCPGLPLVVEPALPGLTLAGWAEDRRAQVEGWLMTHGAVLFRGFALQGVVDFERCVSALSDGALEYRFRASPRTEVGRHIYTATDYPSEQPIFPHNEHAYSPTCPLRLFFYCETPAVSGGGTPIGSVRRITQAIAPEVRARFEARGVLYVRNLGEGFGLPWQTVFQTDDPAEVERYCRSVGIACEWRSGGRLRTRQVGPAVVRHPQSGEALWFNHAAFFHVTTLPPAIREALCAELPEDDLPQNTYYGDGSPIEPEALLRLRAIYHEALVRFAWRQGDVLFLDNVLAVHARDPYRGARRVLVAMAESFRPADHALRPAAG